MSLIARSVQIRMERVWQACRKNLDHSIGDSVDCMQRDAALWTRSVLEANIRRERVGLKTAQRRCDEIVYVHNSGGLSFD